MCARDRICLDFASAKKERWKAFKFAISAAYRLLVNLSTCEMDKVLIQSDCISNSAKRSTGQDVAFASCPSLIRVTDTRLMVLL